MNMFIYETLDQNSNRKHERKSIQQKERVVLEKESTIYDTYLGIQ